MALVVRAVSPNRVVRGQLNVVGQPKAYLPELEVGTFTVTCMSDTESAKVGKGWRLLFQDGDETVLSGPVESISPDILSGLITFSGLNDMCHMDERLVYPNPARTAEQQTTDAYYKRSGQSGQLVYDLIRSNLSTGALADRRVDGFVVSSPAGLGISSTTNLRYQTVLEAARALARAGGFTFTSIQEPDNRIVVRLRAVANRSRSVRFTARNDGVSEGNYALVGPTATTVIVAGQGQGAARSILERSRATEWGRRIEVFKDQRDTDDQAELEKSAKEQLDEGQAGASAQFTITEPEGLRFGVDFNLGDTVAVEAGSETIVEPVRAAELVWNEFGRQVTLTLGDHDDADDKKPEWVKWVSGLDARLRRQERQ